MNKKIAKVAESLDTVHTHTHTHTHNHYLPTAFTNKTQYVSKTCRKMQVNFNMQKMKLEYISKSIF